MNSISIFNWRSDSGKRARICSTTGNADFSGTAKVAKLVSDTELHEYQFPKLEKGELEEELDKIQDTQ
ncbi:MAG: hypothetical protein KGS72_17835 [Cyanobacteria bacterium REEB67]|nr:hypothetical protein [Cyanobacteria bacterium REEB67]